MAARRAAVRSFLLRRLPLLLIGAALLVGFGAFIWPTPYRPIALKNSRAILAARQQRVTGRVDVLTKTGWHALEPSAPLLPTPDKGDSADAVAAYLAKYGKGATPSDSARP